MKVFYIYDSGADSLKFLQGQCTNDLVHLKQHGNSVAAAFLTTKGRVFSDAIIYLNQPKDANESEYFIELNAKLATELKKYLTVFKLRSKVKMELLDFNIYLDTKISTSKDLEQYQNSNQKDLILSCLDPRIESYGARLIFPGGVEPEGLSKDKFFPYYFEAREYVYGLLNSLYMTNKVPFECNLDLLKYINFHKGCYVGQELMARTKYKGMVRKRILPFHLISDPQLQVSESLSTVDKELLLERLLSNDNNTNAPRVGDHLYSSKSADSSVGEIVAVDSKGLIGFAVVQLDQVFSHKGSYIIRVKKDNGDDSYDLENVTIFRPDWFTGLDEKTYLTKD